MNTGEFSFVLYDKHLFDSKIGKYRNIPNRSPGGLGKSPGGDYIRFTEPGETLTNAIYKRNLPSKVWGASIRGVASNRDNYGIIFWVNLFQVVCLAGDSTFHNTSFTSV